MAALNPLDGPAPTAEMKTVRRGGRKSSRDLGRTREHLTEAEVARLLAAVKGNRHGHRDATMIHLAYRHGLRASELVDLRWDQIEFATARLHIRRLKHGNPATHPIQGDTLRMLRRLQREQTPPNRFVFVSERGDPFSRDGFQKMVARAGQQAGFAFGVHPHMLRHATGHKLVNAGVDTRTIQDYLGHKNIVHTVRYTALADDRFQNLW